MKKNQLLTAIVSGMGVGAVSSGVYAADKQPNVVIILADDMGWSDISPFGGEIDTPNLQALANQGVKFTNFHATPYSGPSRAALLTGTDSHYVGLGNLAEITTKEQREGNPEGYAGYLNDKAITLAEYLKTSGYHTIMSGKWHLGIKEEQDPTQKGFDKALAMLRGEYYHYPSQTTENGKQLVYGNYKDADGLKMYRKNGQVYEEPQNFFSSDAFTDFAIEEINQRPDGKPFFLYLAYTAPHSPLQAPQQYIDKYQGKYTEGPQVLANQRFAAVKKLGLVPENIQQPTLVNTPDWQSLSEQERLEFAKRMQVYAAMIDNMDANIGRLVADLKSRGELENTIFMFLSDNGAAGAFREGDRRWGKWVTETHDNSLANMGREKSYISTGPDWAQASSMPFALFKGYTTEGGLRSPLIVSGPGIQSGAVSGSYGSIIDIAPTVLSLTGVKVSTPEGKAAMTGENLLSQLQQADAKITGPSKPRVMESMGGKSVRFGDYKALATSRFETIHGLISDKVVKDTWQLFDLSKDPGETQDISLQEPEVLKQLVDAYYQYAKEAGVVEVSPTKLP